ncbi:hypothetical protein E8E12_011724 [Didymella heteroderae]|uniref:Uncharacterized protein n=1 Tax=Didymella heteroderae TaxID=1769908 RepID=A0A9P4X323_9PLEO|nr:hypothetical protein E8E12_011724 [Didymella heteroderae]
MGFHIVLMLAQNTIVSSTINPTDCITSSDEFCALYLEMLRFDLLPKLEDLVPFLDAARKAAEDRYQEPQYAYVRESLCKVFNDRTGWLGNEIEPSVILLEALQDERAILDRHNRMQARAYPGRRNTWSIPDKLVNFPLRFMCLAEGDVKLPTGFFKPIYQATEVSNLSRPPVLHEPPAAHRQSSMGKLSDAPSPIHDFPDGNFTLAEIAAFLPQSIKSWDIADRIIWNGAASEDLAIMFNKYRGLDPKIHPNSVYLMFRGQMRKRTQAEHGYKRWNEWTVSAQAIVKKPAGFNADSISVTGFRRPVVFKNKSNVPAVPIPFKNLAMGVAAWPEDADALDLTRCVRWCVEHPDAEIFYPTHYQTVLERVGGPRTSGVRHSDASALARLRSDTGRLAPRRRTAKDFSYGKTDSEEGSDDTELRKRKRGLSFRDNCAKRCKSNTGSSNRATPTMGSIGARSSAESISRLAIDFEEDIDDDTYQGPKRTKKNKDGLRRSGRNNSKITSYADLDVVDFDEEDHEVESEDQDEYDAAEDEDED